MRIDAAGTGGYQRPPADDVESVAEGPIPGSSLHSVNNLSAVGGAVHYAKHRHDSGRSRKSSYRTAENTSMAEDEKYLISAADETTLDSSSVLMDSHTLHRNNCRLTADSDQES